MVDRRLIDPDDLVTSYDIAVRLGVSQSLVLTWARREYNMPVPVAQVGKSGRMKLWLWSEVSVWAVAMDLLQQVPVTSPPLDPDPLLTGAEVAELVGWTNAGTAWQQHKVGTFPAPAGQFGRTRVWRRSDVVAWVATNPRRPSRRENPGKL